MYIELKINNNIIVEGLVRPARYSDADIRHDIIALSEEIESYFGVSSSSLSLRAIVFSNVDAYPCTFYPDAFPECIDIHLVDGALRDSIVTRFQLAHELVHCLCPLKVKGGSAKVIEEGMATRFQLGAIKRWSSRKDWLSSSGAKKWKDALDVYRELTSNCSGAIKRLRTIEPCISLWTHETFVKAGISIAPELEARLLESF